MASTSTRRIQKELGDLTKSPIPNITVEADEADLQQWAVTMKGPPGTPYKGGTFRLSVKFTSDFPFKAPQIMFTNKVYHPNIDGDGNICIGLLKTEQWKPSTKMTQVLQSLYELLAQPNPDDPLVASIAETYTKDRKTFDQTAAEYTAKYAKA